MSLNNIKFHKTVAANRLINNILIVQKSIRFDRFFGDSSHGTARPLSLSSKIQDYNLSLIEERRDQHFGMAKSFSQMLGQKGYTVNLKNEVDLEEEDTRS